MTVLIFIPDIRACIFGLTLAFAATVLSQTVNQEDLRFREAIHKEQVEGDLNAAIKLYRAIASASNRTLAAKALVNLGRCYEKLGDVEAQKAYEKVLRDFADQSEAAREARSRLAKIAADDGSRSEAARRVSKPLRTFQIATVSRDGRFAAYVIRNQSIPILLDLTTGTEQQLGRGNRLVPLENFSHSAAISPDALNVAYNHCRGTRCELRMIGVKSAEPKVVASEFTPFYIADWSRDGSSLLLREIYESARWLLVNAQTGETKTLLIPPAAGLGIIGSERRHAQARLSPDGRWIAYSSLNAGGDRRTSVFVTTMDNETTYRFSDEAADAYVFGWSPRGDRLFYVSDQAGSYDLWATPIKDGKPDGIPALIKKDVGLAQGCGIADNGSLFYSVVSNVGDLYVGDLDVEAAAIRSLQRISQPPGAVTSNATWSPDGTRLLINRLLPPHFASAAMIRDAVTGEEKEAKPPLDHARRLTAADGTSIYLHQACWGPGGKSVCFGVLGDGPWTLLVADLETGDVQSKVEGSALVYNWPEILPDGKHALVARSGSAANFSPVVGINLETGEEQEICRATRPRAYAVSPDGSQLACTGLDEVIRVYPMQGGAPRELLKVRSLGQMTWTADGRHLIYTVAETPANVSGVYWIVQVSGGTPRRLNAPTSRIGQMSIHPDGRRISIVSSGISTELWVLENVNRAPNNKLTER